MEALVFLDTHVVVWLAAGRTQLLTARAREAVEQAERLLVSPMVHLELQYLHEIERLGADPGALLLDLAAKIDVQLADFSFRGVAEASRKLTWTRDPFDRLIVGHAMAASGALVTQDESIRANFPRAIW